MGPPPDVLGQALWAIGSALCHQMPERSLVMGTYQLPVCARDLGTYMGFLIATSFYFLGKRYRRVGLPDRAMLVLATIGVAFFLFDALSSYVGFRDTDNTLRLASGLAFGTGAAMLLLSVSSVQLFHGREARATFACTDGLLIYPFLALIGLALLTIDEKALYYPVAIAAELGLMIILFLLAATTLSLLFPRLGQADSRIPLIFLSIGLVVIFVAALLLLHSLVALPLAY